jgi:hypothetical protein
MISFDKSLAFGRAHRFSPETKKAVFDQNHLDSGLKFFDFRFVVFRVLDAAGKQA